MKCRDNSVSYVRRDKEDETYDAIDAWQQLLPCTSTSTPVNPCGKVVLPGQKSPAEKTKVPTGQGILTPQLMIQGKGVQQALPVFHGLKQVHKESLSRFAQRTAREHMISRALVGRRHQRDVVGTIAGKTRTIRRGFVVKRDQDRLFPTQATCTYLCHKIPPYIGIRPLRVVLDLFESTSVPVFCHSGTRRSCPWPQQMRSVTNNG